METPLVSVIIPTRNSADYISETIQSCLDQTYWPIEIIVVDNASDDLTADVLGPFVRSGQIRYVRQEDRGPSGARNTGIGLARGEYLQFLDADDLLLPEKIARQVVALEGQSESCIAACDYRYFNGSDLFDRYGGDVFEGQFPLKSFEKIFEFHAVIHRWLFPAMLVRQIGGFEEDVAATEDWLLLWKVILNGARSIYIDEPLVLYRQHDRNLSLNFEKIALCHLVTIDCVAEYQLGKGIALYSKRELDLLREGYLYELSLLHLRNGRYAKAWRLMSKALFRSANRLQIKLLLLAMIPVARQESEKFVRLADRRLWRWRAQLRKALVG